MTRRPPARVIRDDTGATIVIAVVVMSILTTLSLAILGRTLSVMTGIRHGQDFDSALAVADAGLADALYTIDQTAPNDFGDTGVSGSGEFSYWADKVNEKEYVVTSVGFVGRSRHAIQAMVRRGAKFPYAIFSDQSLHFDGNIASPAMRIQFYTFNRAVGDPDIVRVGSNKQVVCNGPVDAIVYIDEYDGHGDCDTTHLTKLEDPREMAIDEPAPPVQACPLTGVFGSALSTPATPVYIDGSGGPFVCRQNVVLLGYLEVVNGPVQIYVLPTVDASGNVLVDNTLDMSTAVINTAAGASQFQIYKDGPAPLIIGNGNTSGTMTFRGVLYAPESRLTINGGLWWTGSVEVNELVVNGAPNLTFGYDYDLAHYLGKDWKIVRYRETASSDAVLIVPPLP